jgi:hypothetical protein
MLKTVGNPSTRFGDQTIVNGNLVIGTAGKGIDFSATPGTGTSELLSDYEEGTWTPSVGGDATYTARVGRYTKIGRLVNVYCLLQINVLGTGSTTTISGLPFANSASAAFTNGSMLYFTLSKSLVNVVPFINAGSPTNIQFMTLTAASTGMTYADAILGDGSYLILNITYEV